MPDGSPMVRNLEEAKKLLVAIKLLIMLHFISSRFLTVEDPTGKSTDPSCT